LAEKKETKVIFTPENVDNKEHRVTALDNSLVDIAPKEGGSVEVTEKGKVGTTHLEAETILDYENENLLKGTDENWVLQSWSGWTAGYMTYTLEELGVQVGDTVTYSMEIDNTLDYENNVQMRALVNFYSSNRSREPIGRITGNLIDTGYKGFSSGTNTIPEGTVKIQAYKAFKNNSGEGKNKIAKTRHQKLERGSEATPYTKAQSELEDDPRIKRDSIPVNIKGERTLDFEGKVRGSEEENSHKIEQDIRKFEIRNYLREASSQWKQYSFGGWNHSFEQFYIGEDFEIGDELTYTVELDNTADDLDKKVCVRIYFYDSNGSSISYPTSGMVDSGSIEEVKINTIIPEGTSYFRVFKSGANGTGETKVMQARNAKLSKGNTTGTWTPAPESIGIPYGQPNLVNHSNYNSRELSEGITELVNDSFLEDTEAKVGDSISSRIQGNLSGYYDGDVLLQGYTNSGANTGEIARKKFQPKTSDQEIWLEEGEIPKDTERLGLYFNRDTDYSMSERNLLLDSKEPQSFKGNGETNQTMGVVYDLTPDLNESYGGENFSFQTDIDVIGYDFGGILNVQTSPGNYERLFEENLRFENHENKLRNPGMNEPFPEGSNLISSLDMYDYDLGPNQTDKVNYYENNKIDWDFKKSDRNPGVRVQNTDVLKNNQDYTLSFDLEVQEGELDRLGGHTRDFSDEGGWYSVDGETYRENLLPEEYSSDSWEKMTINHYGDYSFQYTLEELGLKVGDTITVQAEIDNSLEEKAQAACVDLRALDENYELVSPRSVPDGENRVFNGEKGLSWVSLTIPEGTVHIRSYIYRGTNEDYLKVACRRRKLSLGDKPTVFSNPGYGSWYAPAPLPEKENLVQNSNLAEDTDYWEGWTSSEVESSNFTRVPLVEESKFPEYAFKIHKEEGPNGKMGVTQKGSDMNLGSNTQYLFKALVRVSDDSPVDNIRAVIEADYGQEEGNSEGYENKHFDVTKEWEPIQLLADSKEGVLYRVGISNEYYGDLLIKDMVVEPVKRSYHVEAHIKSNDKAMDNRGFFIQPNRTPKEEEKPASKGEITNIQLEEGSEASDYESNIVENIEDWKSWGDVRDYTKGTRRRKVLPDPEDSSKEVTGWEISKVQGKNTNLGFSQNVAVDPEGYYAFTAWARVTPDSENSSAETRIRIGLSSAKNDTEITTLDKDWKRISVIHQVEESRNDISLFLGLNRSSYGKIQIARPKFERAEEHHRIEDTTKISSETLSPITRVGTRADNLPESLEVTMSNAKWEMGSEVSPYSEAPEDLDDPGQYSKLEDVEIQVIKGPKEAQDEYKPSYVDFYQKTMLQSQARTAIGTPPNLPSLENYTPFKAPNKSLPSSLTYSSVPKFDPKVELPQGHYDKLNTDGESIKAKTKLVGQNAEFTLIFDTVRFTEEAFPELFEGLTEMKDKIDKYHEVAIRQEVFATARGNNGVEDMVYLKWRQHGSSVWEGGKSSNSSSSLSEISRILRKGNNFWDGRWVSKGGNNQGKSLALLTTKDTEELTEKEVELSKARLEVTIQPPENPNATPRTITVLPE